MACYRDSFTFFLYRREFEKPLAFLIGVSLNLMDLFQVLCGSAGEDGTTH
jgi:hypothetical protein